MGSAARRAGASRLKGIKRVTCFFNPSSTQGHCGYQAVLKASGRRLTYLMIKKVRKAVALQLRHAYDTNEVVAGWNIHKLLEFEGQSIEEYMAETCKQQWASVVELALACRTLGVRVVLCVDGSVQCLTQGPYDWMIVMKGAHYLLYKKGIASPYHKKPCGKPARAGMNRGRSRSRDQRRDREVDSQLRSLSCRMSGRHRKRQNYRMPSATMRGSWWLRRTQTRSPLIMYMSIMAQFLKIRGSMESML